MGARILGSSGCPTSRARRGRRSFPARIGHLGRDLRPDPHRAILRWPRMRVEQLGLERVELHPAARAPAAPGPPSASRRGSRRDGRARYREQSVLPRRPDRNPPGRADVRRRHAERPCRSSPRFWTRPTSGSSSSAQAFAGLPTWKAPRAGPLSSPVWSLCRARGTPTPDREFARGVVPGPRGSGGVPRWAAASHISASDPSSECSGGWSVRYLVPDAVVDYIGDHGLYRA